MKQNNKINFDSQKCNYKQYIVEIHRDRNSTCPSSPPLKIKNNWVVGMCVYSGLLIAGRDYILI